MKPRYYRRDGTPYTGPNALLEWAHDMGRRNLKIVRQDTLTNGCRISTVWLGLNHNFNDDEPPLIFETMVFGPDNFEDLDMDRYATEIEAIEGHHEMVKKWKEKDPPFPGVDQTAE